MENAPKPQKRGRKPKTVKQEEPVNVSLSENEIIEKSNVGLVEEKVEEKQTVEEQIEQQIAEEVEQIAEEVEQIVEEVEQIVEEITTTVEQILEEQTIEVNNSLEIKSLLNVMIITTIRPEMQEKYNLSQETVKVLLQITQQFPHFFFKLEESFKKIAEDNKIDSNDVPELMGLFSIIYELLFSLKLQKTVLEMSEICGEIIKLTFNVAIEEGLVKFESLIKEEVAKTFNLLVDSSAHLVKLSKSISPPNKCCSFW
jgi:hypothetical protein